MEVRLATKSYLATRFEISLIGLSKSEIKPPKGGFIFLYFFVKLIGMKLKIIYVAMVLVVLVVLFGVFYSRSREVKVPIIDTTTDNAVKPQESTYEEYLQQGIEYESTGELDKAIDAYKKAAQAKPKAYVPYSNLGSIYRQNKEFTKAEEAFKKALSISPQSVSIYRKLYELYRYDLKKHPQEMTLFFSNAFKQTNNDIDLMKLYAFYLEDINDPEPALAIWKAFLQAEPNNELYIQKVKSLEVKVAN